MYTNLDHLSSEKINAIKRRYYEGESVYQIMAETELQIVPAQFYRLLPPDTIENYGCSQCRVSLVVNATSRSRQNQKKDPLQYYCPICGKKPFAEKRGWYPYPFLSEEERTNKKCMIAAYYERKIPLIEHETLSLRHKVYLAVLCKALLNVEHKMISPLYGMNITLAATKELQGRIYSELIKEKIIRVSAESELDAFDIESEQFPRNYDKEKVAYKLNIKLPDEEGKYPSWLKKLVHITSEVKITEVREVWTDIAVGECIAYLEYRLNKVGFQFVGGEKTKEVFRKLLENFSVSQIYYIIWCKVADASRWYLEGGVSKQRAANSVVGTCLRYGSNAVFYERELPQYHRPADCPRSILTRYFYSEILKLGSKGDDVCPAKYDLGRIKTGK